MKENLILSVEHSGTRFVRNYLLRGHPSFYHHLVPAHRAFLEGLIPQYRNLFIPLRHPFAIARSWAAKNMALHQLRDRFGFLTSLDRFSPCWVPVDAEDRMAYIDEAQRRTGMELNPGNWPKIGEDRANRCYRLTDDDLTIVGPIVEQFVGFFDRFYSEALNYGPFHKQRSAA